MAEANGAQRAQWNGESGQRWVADADRRDRVLEPAARVLLAAADLRPGERVLDIGCGCGATTVAAADRVAPGTAVGADISRPMLELARERTAGRRDVGFVEADVQTVAFEERFDVAISRFGSMFFDDPAAAFRNLRRAMRPAGRLCLVTWQPLEANDWLVVPGSVLLAFGTLPDAGSSGPGMFSQSDPAEVTAVLRAAGWHRIEVEATRIDLRLGDDAAEATDYLADTGIARRVLETIEPRRRSRAIAAVRELLEDHQRDGVVLGAGVNVIRGTAT